MKRDFFTGFVTGFILKRKILNIGKCIVLGSMNAFYALKKKKTINKVDSIVKIEFVCNITDIETFNKLFPDIPNCQKTQPYWDYFPDKKIIKINKINSN